MNLLELVAFLALQPALSPAFPYPLPAAVPGPEELTRPAPPPPTHRVVWYPESLTFSLRYGFVHAGEATLTMKQTDQLRRSAAFGGGEAPRLAYRVTSMATSNGFVDKFYKVRDVNRSWIDTETLRSLAFSKVIREGTFKRDEWYQYYPEKHRFLYQRRSRDNQIAYRQGVMPENVQDVLSALYYVRTQKLEVGKDVIIDVNTGDNWPMVVKVLEKDTVKTPLGKFDCFVVEPIMRAEGIFIQKGHDLKVWLTDDERKMPVRMEVEIFVGHVSAVLTKVDKE